MINLSSMHETPLSFLEFWRTAGPGDWFGKAPSFDRTLRERFLTLHEHVAASQPAPQSADEALALVLLLDQVPRNAFRGTARMYATDALARSYAARAVDAGDDTRVASELRFFFYLPFAHSESMADQDRSVALHERIGYTSNAKRHRSIIRRFGRFPHRNPILGRATTADEQRFLDEGGFAG